MKLKLILISSTLLLMNLPAYAANTVAAATSGDTDTDTGVKTYHPTPKAKAAASAKTKMEIPPPPKETTPGNTNAALPTGGRPEAVKTAIESTAAVLGSGTYTSANNRVQRFVSYLEIKPGMDTAPLTMHLANHGFSWFRVLIANQVVATDKNFKGKAEGDLDLTGNVQAGTNQLVVQAAGAPGATFEWKVTTPAVAKIDKVDPEEVVVGDDFKIKGKNFDKEPGKNTVLINTKTAQVTRARSTELSAKVPTDADIGDNKLSVKVNGVESNKVKIKVRGIPELSGANLQGVPPGQSLTIFGKNFSKNLSENQVFFGDTSAQVVSGNETQLTVIVPTIPYTAGHTPSAIRVQVGKVMSKNTTSVQVGPQMFTDPGLAAPQQDVPQFNPQDLPRSNY
jgi:hypothetical protein